MNNRHYLLLLCVEAPWGAIVGREMILGQVHTKKLRLAACDPIAMHIGLLCTCCTPVDACIANRLLPSLLGRRGIFRASGGFCRRPRQWFVVAPYVCAARVRAAL